MEIRMDLSSSVCLLLIVYALQGVSGATSRNHQRQERSAQYDYYQNQHYEQYDSHPDYSYSQREDYDVPVQETKCYVCEYTVLASENIQEGDRDCMDPFDGRGVPEVECEHPCAKKYENKGLNSYTIRRACLEGCSERSTKDGSYTLCCTGHLCNGFSSSYVIKDQRWLLLACCLVSALLASIAAL